VSNERKQAEADFHDQRERDRQSLTESEFLKKYSNKKFYSITRRSRAYVEGRIAQLAPGVAALDYCCGLGQTSLQLARAGAKVHGIDISPESVATAERLLAAHDLSDRAQFSVMDAEALEFPDESFDLIVCSGVLHHLDLDRAYRELARVLRPGGRVLCIEALAHNPAIALYRRLTPQLRTSWEVDHILRVQDIHKAWPFFGAVNMRFFHLCSIAAVPIRRAGAFSQILGVLEHMDDVALRIPGLQRMAWQVVFELSQPKTALATRPASQVGG